MKKINFVNGTTIDGASTFNQMQDNVEEVFNGEEPMGSIVVEGITSKNVFNKDTATKTYVVSKDDGSTISSATGAVSDYINVEGKSKLIVSGTTINFQNGGAFYNSSKTYISGFSSTQMLAGVNIPTNAKYVRVNTTLTDLNTTQVEFNDVATENVPYKKYGYNSQESMGKIVVDDISCKNILENRLVTGTNSGVTYTHNTDTSTTINGTASSSYRSTGNIMSLTDRYILKAGTYTFSCNNIANTNIKIYISLYNMSTMAWVSDITVLNSSTLSNTFTTLSDYYAHIYFLVEAGQSVSNVTAYVQLEKGDKATPYTPYKRFDGRTDIITGQEMPTNEYADGKRVYVKRINCGALPNTGLKIVPHGLTNFTIERFEGKANTGTYYVKLPHVSTTLASNIAIGISATEIEITTGSNRSGFTGIVDIYYTKTTDTQTASTMSLRPDTTEVEETE